MDMANSENQYINDILAQPDAVWNSISDLSNGHDAQRFASKLANGDLDRVLLTGMGASYHALFPLYYELIMAGIDCHAMETSELIHCGMGVITPTTLIVVVSQSGRSAEVVGLLDQISDPGRVIGITNTPDAPLADLAGSVLLTQAGDELSVSCKTYVSALAMLGFLGNCLTGTDPTARLQELEQTAGAITDYFQDWQPKVAELTEVAAEIDVAVFVGRGAALATAGTAALITLEASHFPAIGMSSAAYRHGPMDMSSGKQLVLVFPGSGAVKPMNESLASDIEMAGGLTRLVGVDGIGPFATPPTAPIGLELVQILPTQLLTIALAQIHNHDAGQFTILNKVTSSE